MYLCFAMEAAKVCKNQHNLAPLLLLIEWPHLTWIGEGRRGASTDKALKTFLNSCWMIHHHYLHSLVICPLHNSDVRA
jgi:hypothetical protein